MHILGICSGGYWLISSVPVQIFRTSRGFKYVNPMG